MKAWEMLYYLEESWIILKNGNTLSERWKSILKVMRWQSRLERKRVAERILKQDGYDEGFVQHAANVLDLKIKYQRRLF